MSQAIRAWPYSKLRAHIIVAAGARLRRKLVNVRRASGRLENASVWPSLARAVSISWTSDGADSISPDGVGERHVARPVAELGQRDDAAVLGPLDQTAPLRRVESTDVGHRQWPGCRAAFRRVLGHAAEYVPSHYVDPAASIVLADTAERNQLPRVESIAHGAIGEPFPNRNESLMQVRAGANKRRTCRPRYRAA